MSKLKDLMRWALMTKSETYNIGLCYLTLKMPSNYVGWIFILLPVIAVLLYKTMTH